MSFVRSMIGLFVTLVVSAIPAFAVSLGADGDAHWMTSVPVIWAVLAGWGTIAILIGVVRDPIAARRVRYSTTAELVWSIFAACCVGVVSVAEYGVSPDAAAAWTTITLTAVLFTVVGEAATRLAR